MDENLKETPEPTSVAESDIDPQTPVEMPVPAPTDEPANLTVLLSPSETRGKWKPFTKYIGGDPESDIPGVRVDGYTGPDGNEYVEAGASDTPTHKIIFERHPYLPPLFLVPLADNARTANAVKRVKRARRNLQKRGLE